MCQFVKKIGKMNLEKMLERAKELERLAKEIETQINDLMNGLKTP